MKKMKVNIKTTIIILLIGIIIALISIILNMKNNNIIKSETNKEQLGEISDNTYVEMQKHLSEVNDKEEKLLSFKSSIAEAITNKGIQTNSTDTEEIIVNNIEKIGEKSVKKLNYQPNETSVSVDKPTDVGSECIAVVSAISTVTNSMSVSFNCEYEILDSTFVTADYNRKMYTAIVKIQNLENITNIQATVSGMYSNNVCNGVSIIILD